MELGLTEIACLEQIQVRGPLNPKEIGQHLNLRSGSATALIDRLEFKGFVERSRRRDDRRSLKVGLTENAFVAAENDMIPLAKALSQIARSKSAHEREVIEAFLSEVNDQLQVHCEGQDANHK
ncbi:MarR family transcriptional regulator [Erythrobacter sp. KMU-140]|uniref:MarR family transcriptional regulator n=2 Tax=Erythrobacter rubeus TaxID=2760803 RepID=A0ABR8KPJ3_9SPHN|nr:MarR family transcriptional regulator [Erythrobacter rubeus]